MLGGAKRVIACLTLAACVACPIPAAVAGTQIQAQVCQPTFDPVTLGSTTASPTTGTSADVNGAANPNANVIITVGGVPKAQLTADLGGTYAATVPLVIGDNTIVATADDGPCGHSDTSPPVLIHRDRLPPPAPSISAPASGYVTTAASVLVQGSAEADSTLNFTVNGAAAASLTVGSDGLFTVSLPLSLGANAIQAAATNPAGTGPLSAPVTVTRQPVTVPPPAPPVVPTPPPASGPHITSPATDTATTAASLTIQIQGQPGATAYVSRNAAVVATVRLDSGGSAEVSVALVDGDNELTITIRGQRSPAIIVYRQAPAPTAPVITSPEDGLSTTDASITVAGQAPPGARVTIMVGQTAAATVEADAAGHFAARVSLRAGFNLIYAELVATDGTHIRSATVQVNHETPASVAASGSLRTFLTNLITLPMAALVLTAQALGAVLGAVAASHIAIILVFGFAGVVSTASRGLLGLELLLMAPGLLRLRPRGLQLTHGQVVDTVTGRPLALAKISAGSGRQLLGITGRDGGFAIAHSAPGAPFGLQASRPGYRPASTQHPGTTIALEPSAAGLSPLGAISDILSGTISWAAMIFAAALGLYLGAHQPGAVSFGAAILSVGLLAANLAALIHQPHYHWGRLTGQGGVPVSGASIALTNTTTGQVVSTYRTDPSGRYTVHAPSPGDYQLTVTSGGQPVHTEPVTIRRRPAYLGWSIRSTGTL